MSGQIADTQGHVNPDGTYTVLEAAQSPDKKTASIVRITAKTQEDAVEKAQQYSAMSLNGPAGSLQLPLEPPDSDLLNITVETATRDGTGAWSTNAQNASYEPGNNSLSGVNPPKVSASSFANALEQTNTALGGNIGSAFDLDKNEIAGVLDTMDW